MNGSYDVFEDVLGVLSWRRGENLADPVRLRVTSKAALGFISVHNDIEGNIEFWVHSKDWKTWCSREYVVKLTEGKPLDRVAGIPVWIDEEARTELKEPALFVRVRDEGPGKQCVEVHDEFGNKLGELKGVSAVDYQLRYREHGKFTVTFRASPAYIESP